MQGSGVSQPSGKCSLRIVVRHRAGDDHLAALPPLSGGRPEVRRAEVVGLLLFVEAEDAV